jgi:ABC-type glutathione transport system ATPase component
LVAYILLSQGFSGCRNNLKLLLIVGQRKKHQNKQGQKMANGVGATAEEKGQFISSNENQNQPIETLHNVELEVPRGKLIGVCGSVGSGKSSLLSAIMGDVSVKWSSEIHTLTLQSTVVTMCIYGFHIILRINSYYFPKQH